MSTFTSFEVARRAVGARWIILLAFVALGSAFFKAQVLEHDRFRLEAGSNRLRPIKLPSPRGDILDRNGLPIAENIPGYSIKLLASNEDSLRAVLGRLLALVPADSVDADLQSLSNLIMLPKPYDFEDLRLAIVRLERHAET